MNPLLIMVAPERRTKTEHPALPMTAGELAETAAQCLAAGANALPDASRPRLLFVLERYARSGESARRSRTLAVGRGRISLRLPAIDLPR